MKNSIKLLAFFCMSNLLIFSCGENSSPRKIATLHQINDPHHEMWAATDRLFVSISTDSLQQRSTVQVYSLNNGQLINSFGGPEVFRIQSAHSVELFLQPDKFAVNSSGKVSIYNYNFLILKNNR